MVEPLKNFFVGLGLIVGIIWALYAVLFAAVSLFTLGQATFAVMPVWSWVLAGIPWAALVVVVIVMIGEDVRKK